jgi:hypothetical protein
MAWPPGASSVSSMTTRYYLSESRRAGRKVFFDFAVLGERAEWDEKAQFAGGAVNFTAQAKFACVRTGEPGVLAEKERA